MTTSPAARRPECARPPRPVARRCRGRGGGAVEGEEKPLSLASICRLYVPPILYFSFSSSGPVQERQHLALAGGDFVLHDRDAGLGAAAVMRPGA